MVDKSSKQKLTFKRRATVLHALLSGKSVLEILAETQNTIFPHPPDLRTLAKFPTFTMIQPEKKRSAV